MLKLIVILVFGLICEAVGVICLSHGLKQVGGLESVSFHTVVTLVKKAVTNPPLMLGVFFETVFFGTLIYLMSKGDVSFVWPLTSLGFVLTTLAARFVLHEHVSPLRWTGVVLIMLGAGVITFSEKFKQQRLPVAVPATSDIPAPPR